MRNADFAMYQAKYSGRNNYQYFRPDINAKAMERQSVELDLRQAIARQEFVLDYQPKVNLATGAVVGVEALIRWHRPHRGTVPPAGFIPVAEESGLILPIGRWALDTACRQARAWQDGGLPPVSIAINVSAVELRGKDFLSNVPDILEQNRLEPRFLELELTETFMMQDWRTTAEILRALKTLGVRIALDDFGTGYSSLSYMWRFPIDVLKDRSSLRARHDQRRRRRQHRERRHQHGPQPEYGGRRRGNPNPRSARIFARAPMPRGTGILFGSPVPAAELTELWSGAMGRPLAPVR